MTGRDKSTVIFSKPIYRSMGQPYVEVVVLGRVMGYWGAGLVVLGEVMGYWGEVVIGFG